MEVQERWSTSVTTISCRGSANGQPFAVPPMQTAPVDPEEQRRLQEREAARLSKLFAGTSVREQAATLSAPLDGTGGTAPVTAPPIGGGRRGR